MTRQQRLLMSALLALLTLLAPWNLVQAVTITPVVIRERISVDDAFAIAGNNGSGPRDGTVLEGAAPRFADTLRAQALDADPLLNASAIAVAEARQDTTLGARNLSSRGSFANTAAIVRSGIVRSEATSELKTTFLTDEDVSFTLTASAVCGGDECESFVVLAQGGTALFDLHVSTGALVQTISGQLLANEPYTLSAFTGVIYALNAEGQQTGAGTYAFELDIAPGTGSTPPVPEPSSAGLFSLGLAASALAFMRPGRRTRRQAPSDAGPSRTWPATISKPSRRRCSTGCQHRVNDRIPAWAPCIGPPLATWLGPCARRAPQPSSASWSPFRCELRLRQTAVTRGA